MIVLDVSLVIQDLWFDLKYLKYRVYQELLQKFPRMRQALSFLERLA